MIQSLIKFKSYTLTGLLQYFWMKLRKKSLLVGGSCMECGNCCKRLSLEGNKGWLRSQKEFREVAARYPEYNRFKLIGKDGNGYLIFNCSWCTDDGKCLDYANRLPLCRNFPEKSLHFSGGVLSEKCGYYFIFSESFDKVLNKELQKKKHT